MVKVMAKVATIKMMAERGDFNVDDLVGKIDAFINKAKNKYLLFRINGWVLWPSLISFLISCYIFSILFYTDFYWDEINKIDRDIKTIYI